MLAVACLLGLTALAPAVRANPESLGTWMRVYGRALGFDPAGLPDEGEYIDDFEAKVARADAGVAFGLTGVVAGDRLALHNHENGYWTITNQRTKHTTKVALVWLVRFGVTPESELPDGEPPDHIRARIVNRAQLAAMGLASAKDATGCSIDFTGDVWVLTLLPSGEKRQVPL
jgi:hypothetical protein